MARQLRLLAKRALMPEHAQEYERMAVSWEQMAVTEAERAQKAARRGRD